MSNPSNAADEQAIRDFDRAWGDAATSHDLDRILAFYAPDGSLVWPGMDPAHGTSAIRAAWTTMITTTPGLSLEFVVEKITVSSSGDLAADFGAVRMGMDGPDDTRVNDIAKYVVTWQKQDGEWKVLYDSWNENTKSS